MTLYDGGFFGLFGAIETFKLEALSCGFIQRHESPGDLAVLVDPPDFDALYKLPVHNLRLPTCLKRLNIEVKIHHNRR